MREIREALGEEFDERFESLRENTLAAIKETYFKGEFLNKQGIPVYGATLGFVSPDAVAEYYENLGHFDTGFLCTDILCELLFESGHGEVFEKLLRSEEPGGYLFMKRHGATTIWENWTGGSHCHPMFGAAARQLFEGILGIKQEKSSSGWEKIVFDPYLPEKMNFAKGSVTTPHGVISVSLERRNGEVQKTITVPDGITVSYR